MITETWCRRKRCDFSLQNHLGSCWETCYLQTHNLNINVSKSQLQQLTELTKPATAGLITLATLKFKSELLFFSSKTIIYILYLQLSNRNLKQLYNCLIFELFIHQVWSHFESDVLLVMCCVVFEPSISALVLTFSYTLLGDFKCVFFLCDERLESCHATPEPRHMNNMRYCYHMHYKA